MAKLVTNKFKPTEAKPIHELVDKPKIVPQDYKTALVDNRTERLDTLIQYAEGSKQKVTYFRQRLSRDDSVTHFSLDSDAVLQQYERIDGLEILLQGSLNYSQQDSELKISELTGEAYIRPPVIPNVGDVILMDIGRGTLGWFNINSVRRMTHRRNTLYEVSFTMAYEIRDQINDPRILNINQKTIEVLKYSEDYLKAGQNPLLTPNKAFLFEKLNREYDRLQNYWIKKFYTRFHETCFIPNQTVLIYDGFLMRAISKWFSSSKFVEMTHFRIYNDEEFPLLKNKSIWEAITDRDLFTLRESFTKAVAIKVDSFTNSTNFASIRYSGFTAVIAPAQMSYSNNLYLKNDDIIGQAFSPIPTVANNTYRVYQDIPLINQVFPDRSYVLSQDFYNDSLEGQSHLELQLRKYFEDNTLEVDVINELVDDVINWGELEQYYLLPILLVLMNYCVRRM